MVSALLVCGVSAQQFDVTSVKPSADGSFAISPMGSNQFSVRTVSLTFLISMAYGVSDPTVVGGPSWRSSEFFDVQAKAEDGLRLDY